MDETTQYHDSGGRTLYMGGGNRRNNNNNWLYGIVAFLVVVLIGGGYYFYEMYKQKEKEATEQNKEKEKEEETTKVEDSIVTVENPKDVQPSKKEEEMPKEVGVQQSTEQPKTVTSPPKSYGRVSDPDGYTNIRRGPSINDAIVKRYYSGDYLYYTPLSNGWSMVYSGNTASTFMGYMSTNRIVKVNPVKENNSTSSGSYHKGYMVDPKDDYVNVRKGPGMTYDIVTQLDINTVVYYITTTNSKWYKVYDMDKNYLGYVYYDRIHKVN